MKDQKNTKRHIRLIPLYGSILFIVLYIIATFYYPGGSHFDLAGKGFSWTQNYWCNLLYEHAINGQRNRAQPIALAGMLVLSVSLSYFWWQFPRSTKLSALGKQTIQISGIAAMVISFFLFTAFFHDTITYAATVLGLIAMTGTFVGLYKNKWSLLFNLGVFNGFLICGNYFLYNSEDLEIYLPVVQKITFFTFLLWVSMINLKISMHFKND